MQVIGIILLTMLLLVCCIQQYIIQDEKLNKDYWYRCYVQTVEHYNDFWDKHPPGRQRKLERAYRTQLKRQYKRSNAGSIFKEPEAGGASYGAHAIMRLTQAANNRDWVAAYKNKKSFARGLKPEDIATLIAGHSLRLADARIYANLHKQVA